MVEVPTHDQLLNPTLKALRKLGGSASIIELLEQVIADSQLPREVIERPHTGKRNRTELEYRLAWARTYLKKYGLITNSTRGVWALTPRGHEVEAVDPQAVNRFVLCGRSANAKDKQTLQRLTTGTPRPEEAKKRRPHGARR